MYRTIPITLVHVGGPVIPPRKGSTLMIVIVLMGLLALLGVLFYTIAAQERSNAEYHAEAAKNISDPGLTADEVFNFALQQWIVGTDPRLKNSVLWGSRHAMLANMLGVKDHALNDLTAFDGQGVVLGIDSTTGLPIVDYDRDGVADTGNVYDSTGGQVFLSPGSSDPQQLLGMNDSPAANSLFERETGRMPQPDVGYTYPDINNAFLAYNGWTRDRTAPFTVRRVIIPSFHRPQLYRDAGGPIDLWDDTDYNGVAAGEDTGVPVDSSGNPLSNRIFRPHPGHVWVPPGRQTVNISRYIATATDAQNLLGDGKRVYPFLPMYPGYNPSSAGATVTLNAPGEWTGHQGVWSGPHASDSAYANPSLSPTYAGSPSGITLHDNPQWDADNDGDGIRDGVWMDLDFPVQELPDGTLYTILFSSTIYDLDALINFNPHGNIQNLLFTYDAANPQGMKFNNQSNPFGWNLTTGQMDWISASNLGVHHAEVNPAWALTGRRGIEGDPTILGDYGFFYGQSPLDASMLPANQQQLLVAFAETANMELAHLKMGRPELPSAGGTPTDLYPGVYGEEGQISRNLGSVATRDPRQFPHPGASLNDDNNDVNEHMNTMPLDNGGTNPVRLEVEHPYDALGLGTYLDTAATTLIPPARIEKTLNRVNPTTTTSRVRWLRYYDYATNGNVFWGQTGLQGGQLMRLASTNGPGGQAYGLYDDPSEVAYWPTDRRDVDDPFSPDDTAFLAMSNSDINTYGISSRLKDLAGFNLASSSSDNSRGEEIRKRFTTLSSDRKNFSLPRMLATGTGVGGRNWEWTDDQGYTVPQGGSKLRFPPTFGAAGSAVARYSTLDPFRPAVRYLLQATRDDLQASQYQQRLSVNQLLVYDNQSNQLQYRDLTPHPLDPGSAVIAAPTTAIRPPLAQLTPAVQEAWARRDRQQMARDIYVLLYLLGCGENGDDSTNPLRTAGTTLYTLEQLEQMARFAVNLVDAQDRDNVITRFKYDTNLANGWDLSDDPYLTVEPGPNATTDRAEVWGVERQELAFSEFIFVNSPAGPSGADRSYTAWTDDEIRQFFCVELRNVAPYRIKFSDPGNDFARWQLMVRQEVSSIDPTKWRLLTLKSAAGQVDPGAFYTIFSTDRNQPTTNPSIMQVDPNGGSSFQPIIPSDTAGTFAGNASANGNFIDLVKEAPNNMFELRDGQSSTALTTTGGELLQDGSNNLLFTDASTPVEVILRRRAHPSRTAPTTGLEEADNPWIEVDRISDDVQQYNPTMGSQAGTELDNIKSRERREILDRALENEAFTTGALPSAPAPTDHVWNTFKSTAVTAENSLWPVGSSAGSMQPFRVWQAHFDRPFSSLGDLLLVPLFGPQYEASGATAYGRKDSTTLYLGAMRLPPAPVAQNGQYGEPRLTAPGIPGIIAADNSQGASPGEAVFQNDAKNGLGMFTVTDHPIRGTQGTVDAFDNRWYRVLEFLEVPTRQHKNLAMGPTFNITRVTGKMNVNTMRHSENLGALLDDDHVTTLNMVYPDTAATPAPTIRDSNYPKLLAQDTSDVDSGGALRDWFQELQNSRDPTDPYWTTVGSGHTLRLPGLAGSRPFQSFAHVGDSANAVEHTLLRTLRLDAEDTGKSSQSHRRLFEVGNFTDHQDATNPLEPLLKHRLLSKIWGNTTVRSNTFVIFASAKLFRVHVDSATGATRIGGPVREFDTPYRDQALDKNPELPEYRGVFLVDRSLLEEGVAAGGGSGVNNFAPFVVYRKILEE
jgi:hypothetical protein